MTNNDQNTPYLATVGSLDSQLRAAEHSLQEEALAEPRLPEEEASAAAAGGNVDKIRDILFGTQMRDYERRFKRTEDRFSKENAHLRDDMGQRIRALEELINSELDSLSDKVKVERQERQTMYQELQQEITSLKNELNNRITQLDELFSKDMKQLRQHMHNKFQEINNQMRQQNDTISTLMKQEVSQLREDKVDRSDLASFFTEFALRLNKDFNPDKE